MIPDGYTVARVEAQAAAVSVVCRNAEGKVWRRSVPPDGDLSGWPAETQDAIRNSITPDMRAAFQATLVPDEPLTLREYSAAVQGHVDGMAASRGYADGVALAGYSTSTIPAWVAEAATFIAWRDQVWLYAYAELARVQGGQRATPTIDGLIAELPVIAWPQ
jgi:hypothetical protein